MEQLNVSLLFLDNTKAYPDNTTSIEPTTDEEKEFEMILTTPQLESNDYELPTFRVVQLVIVAVIIIFGSVGNILTFIVMQRGSLFLAQWEIF